MADHHNVHFFNARDCRSEQIQDNQREFNDETEALDLSITSDSVILSSQSSTKTVERNMHGSCSNNSIQKDFQPRPSRFYSNHGTESTGCNKDGQTQDNKREYNDGAEALDLSITSGSIFSPSQSSTKLSTASLYAARPQNLQFKSFNVNQSDQPDSKMKRPPKFSTSESPWSLSGLTVERNIHGPLQMDFQSQPSRFYSNYEFESTGVKNQRSQSNVNKSSSPFLINDFRNSSIDKCDFSDNNFSSSDSQSMQSFEFDSTQQSTLSNISSWFSNEQWTEDDVFDEFVEEYEEIRDRCYVPFCQ